MAKQTACITQEDHQDEPGQSLSRARIAVSLTVEDMQIIGLVVLLGKDLVRIQFLPDDSVSASRCDRKQRGQNPR
jgi:hypothetical protein